MASFVDITNRKQAEAAQGRYLAELERSNKELDDFAYVASHDLRAPLRGIDNVAHWVLEDAGDVLPEESRVHLQKLHHRVKRMEYLLDDLLRYSRVGRVQWRSERIDTRELVVGIAELLAPDEFTVTVADDLPTLTTTRAALEQVFRNLIGNAIKHHDRPNGNIKITARPVSEYSEFTVADDGPGIAPEFHERIFRMFQTLKPRDEVEGSGIGLALVRKIVEGLGGTVCVQSAEGQGASFRFTWPGKPSRR
jgi:signal transduction histidine kinase